MYRCFPPEVVRRTRAPPSCVVDKSMKASQTVPIFGYEGFAQMPLMATSWYTIRNTTTDSSGGPHWDPRVRRREDASARPGAGGAAASSSGSEVRLTREDVVRWKDEGQLTSR